ncbi:MAG: hypothetical protein WC875_04130 [Candidatus Absconditabacterales bacterium]|jgi:hypothetical protein
MNIEEKIFKYKKNPYALWAMRIVSIIVFILVAVPTVMIYGTRPSKLPHHLEVITSVWQKTNKNNQLKTNEKMKTNKNNGLKRFLLWELALSSLLAISVICFPSKSSLKEILNSNNVGLLVYKVLQLYCIVGMIALVTSNATVRQKTKSIKKVLFVAIMKFIHRPIIVWIIRMISLPIFMICAIGIFGCPKPCDSTFIDGPVRIVWGNKRYKRWHNYCLNMHYSIVYAFH